MATTDSTVGIDHVTVVPENFEPADSLRPGPAFEDSEGDDLDDLDDAADAADDAADVADDADE